MHRTSLLPMFLGALLGPAAAHGHGGLPISTEIVWREQTMYVPTQYWGVFIGSEQGPWRWICDEAINQDKLREVYLGGDNTFYATDLMGFTVSRDGGCSWEAHQGDLAKRDLTALVPDPARPRRLWAVSAEQNGRPVLWRSDDSGRSFLPLYVAPGQSQPGLAVAPDGQRLYLTALQAGAVPTLYTSTDGGESFAGRPLAPRPRFLRTKPIAVDPRDPRTVYALNIGDPSYALLRIEGDTGGAKELLRLERPIFGVTVDQSRDRLLVATGDGLYYLDGPAGVDGVLRRSEHPPGLSRAQCVSVQQGQVYACSWNYYPDHAAVARSDDGGLSFRSLFQYDKTQGVLECPQDSTVARVCPGVWYTYASLLGIDPGPAPADMGRAEGPPPEGPSCAVGGRSSGSLPSLGGLLVLLLAVSRRQRSR